MQRFLIDRSIPQRRKNQFYGNVPIRSLRDSCTVYIPKSSCVCRPTSCWFALTRSSMLIVLCRLWQNHLWQNKGPFCVQHNPPPLSPVSLFFLFYSFPFFCYEAAIDYQDYSDRVENLFSNVLWFIEISLRISPTPISMRSLK